MTVEFMEAFGQYRTAADMGPRWTLSEAGAVTGTNLSIVQEGPTTFPGQPQTPRSPRPSCLKFLGKDDDAINATICKLDITAATETIIAFNFRPDTGEVLTGKGDTSSIFLTARDASGNVHNSLEIIHGENIADEEGCYLVVQFSISTTRFDSRTDVADGKLRWGEWYYIEFRQVIDNTAGELELRVNGEQWFYVTGIDTLAAGVATVSDFEFRAGHPTGSNSYGSGLAYSVTDIIVIDRASTPNDTFPYPAVIDMLYPDAEVVGEIDFTPQTGSDNAAMVDEVRHDYDTTYNEANVATNKDRFTVGGSVPQSGFGEVLAVGVQAIAKDTAASGTRQARVVIYEGATEAQGATQTLSENDFMPIYDIFEQNPDTTAQWDMAEVEAAEIGYEIVT